MQHQELRRAAQLIGTARTDGATLHPLADEIRPRTEVDAYAIQQELHNILSATQIGTTVGYKIGCTTLVMQEYLGIPNPCAGGLFQPVHHGKAMLKHSDYQHPGVEAEVAVLLGKDVQPRVGGHDRDSVAEAVQAVCAAIEVVDDRWDDYTVIDTPSLIADDFFAASFVLGEPVEAWRDLDLGGLPGKMRINGNPVGSGSSGDILGHPFEALAWLASLVESRGDSLERGQIVMLGSVVQTSWVEPMDEVQAEIDGLGEVIARFG